LIPRHISTVEEFLRIGTEEPPQILLIELFLGFRLNWASGCNLPNLPSGLQYNDSEIGYQGAMVEKTEGLVRYGRHPQPNALTPTGERHAGADPSYFV
jgi:hypothetical protein